MNKDLSGSSIVLFPGIEVNVVHVQFHIKLVPSLAKDVAAFYPLGTQLILYCTEELQSECQTSFRRWNTQWEFIRMCSW